SYIHSKFEQYAPNTPFFEKTQVHVHIPEGATPKDGPSAGITMATAILSLLKNEPIRQDLGMTGELTLTGKVLPIGGLKEKLIAARRSGAKVLIFPKDNQRDYDELPAYIKKGIQIHFVTDYEQVYHVAFPKHKK
ncbi:MAG TPA: S16 family serine protease, partial [Rhabdochlamydiaceae bacterium]